MKKYRCIAARNILTASPVAIVKMVGSSSPMAKPFESWNAGTNFLSLS